MGAQRCSFLRQGHSLNGHAKLVGMLDGWCNQIRKRFFLPKLQKTDDSGSRLAEARPILLFQILLKGRAKP